jgi:hypothetical protein
MEQVNNSLQKIRNAVPAPSGGWTQNIGAIAALVLGAIALYYVYNFFFEAQGLDSKMLISNAVNAKEYAAKTRPNFEIPAVYEGGEYSITFWTYITAYRDTVGIPKHILELEGSTNSTLVVGLGPNTNKLMVRVRSSGTGTDSLTKASVASMFSSVQPMAGGSPMCDLPEIDMQKWVCIGIVLNGRTVDVYMDGKLARSCVLPSFYRVDANGVTMKVLSGTGFDGFLSNLFVYNQALNPDQIYRVYMNGPADIQAAGFLGWLKSIFDITGEVTYKYPQVGMTYPRTTVQF